MRALLLTACLASTLAVSAEHPLSFTEAGPMTEAGTHELLVTLTPRFGRPEAFTRFEGLAGFAYGLSSRLEVQVFLAVALESAGIDERATEGALGTRWRWQPLDPAKDVLGLDVVGTLALTPESVFLEARVGAEKWVGDFLFALNLSADYVARSSSISGPQTHLEQSGGIVYRLGNHFTSGFEVRSRIGFEGGEHFGTAIYAGPVFGYVSHSWWMSFGFEPQVAAVKVAALREKGSPLELRDNEQFVARLQLGFEVP